MLDDILHKLENATTLSDLEDIRVATIGKKGILSVEFSKIANISPDNRKEFAQRLNEFKQKFESAYVSKKHDIETRDLQKKMRQSKVDASLYSGLSGAYKGHPINGMIDIVVDYFTGLNFSLHEGPFIEDEFHNFEALNLPKFHPARDMQDTFYFRDGYLLRTHTSPVQIRTMKGMQPPIRMICTGATFRRDYDLTHSPMFHQCEGLVVDRGNEVSFANLKDLLLDFLHYLFEDIRVRFRSSFFPFTEPSAEVDISCVFCDGDGCRVCSGTGWLEVLGCGVVDENVFRSVGYKDVSGYAFGLGIDRLAMLKWGYSDLRSFYELDLRSIERR